jgi:hypothetical protein
MHSNARSTVDRITLITITAVVAIESSSPLAVEDPQ